MRVIHKSLAVVMVATSACAVSPGEAGKAGDKAVGTAAGTAAATAAEAAAEKVADKAPIAVPEKMFIADYGYLRVFPIDSKTFEDPDTHRRENNVKGETVRGMEVVKVRREGEFCDIRLELGAEGWVRCDEMIPVGGVTKATVLEDTAISDEDGAYGRPMEKPVLAGSILLVQRSHGDYSLVRAGGGVTGWVRTAALVSDPDELRAATLIARVRRTLETDGRDDYIGIYTKGKALYGHTRLSKVIGTVIPANEIPAELRAIPTHLLDN